MSHIFVDNFAAALCLRGPGALLNFPKLAGSLPRPLDLSDKCIQAASNEAAKRFSREVKAQRRLFRLNSSLPNIASEPVLPSSCSTAILHSRVPVLAPCNMELESYNQPPPTSYVERIRHVGDKSCEAPMNHALSTHPKLEVTSDDHLGEEFERSRSLDSWFIDGKLQQRQPSEVLCIERGMQFLEEDMMFSNLASFVVEAPPSPYGHDEGVNHMWEPRLWSF